MRAKLRFCMTTVFAWAALVLSAPAMAAEEGAVQALAPWHGEGTIYMIGTNEALFLGNFSGIVYAQGRKGALDAAAIVCPGTTHVNLTDKSMAGEGRCIITTQDKQKIYAEWKCSGAFGVGCTGRFRLTGGTGKFVDITGESDFLIRSGLWEIETAYGSDVASHSSAGLAQWPELRYRIP